MTRANLEGKVVSKEFWPRCGNCKFYAQCQENPRHPAFPHRWHWSREQHRFPDGTMLLTRSWVGTAAYGMDHTGCYDYQAADAEILEPSESQVKFLEVEQEIQKLNADLTAHENRDSFDEDYDAKYERYFDLFDEQDKLRSAT